MGHIDNCSLSFNLSVTADGTQRQHFALNVWLDFIGNPRYNNTLYVEYCPICLDNLDEIIHAEYNLPEV